MKLNHRVFRFALSLALFLSFAVSGVASAETPDVIPVGGFTLFPTSAYPGQDVDFDVTFGNLTSASSSLCIYYGTSNTAWYQSTMPALDDGFGATALSTIVSVMGVSYVRQAVSTCPSLAGNTSVQFTAPSGDPGGTVGPDDELIFTVRIPNGAANQQFRARQLIGAAGSGLPRPATFNVLAALGTYASTDGVCGGSNPCFTDLQLALDYVPSGSTVHVISAFTGSYTLRKDLTLQKNGSGSVSGLSGGTALNATAGNVVIRDLTINANIGGGSVAVGVTGGSLVVKGNTINGGGQTVFNQSGGALSAYANNISNIGTALSGTGNVKQNWWGSYSTSPSGLPAGDWAARLGAPVNSWADGVDSATLGSATLAGGNGSAVIVSHLSTPPFGNGITPYVNTMCGPYMDFFVRDATSDNWSMGLPVNNSTACNTNVRDAGKVFIINDITECASSTDVACWDLVTTGVVASGQILYVNGLTAATLQGLQAVVGSTTGTDPTVISLRSLTATSARNTWLPVALLAFAVMLGGGGIWLARRRH